MISWARATFDVPLNTFIVLSSPYIVRTGAGGFEPPNDGAKVRCLTAWLRPSTELGPITLPRQSRRETGIRCPGEPPPRRLGPRRVRKKTVHRRARSADLG